MVTPKKCFSKPKSVTLNEFDKEICHHTHEKSKEWVKIWINETPLFDVCNTLKFFENDINLLKRENERLRALFNLKRESSFRMINEGALRELESDELFSAFQKRKQKLSFFNASTWN